MNSYHFCQDVDRDDPILLTLPFISSANAAILFEVREPQMLGMNRREYIQGMLAALRAATALPHSNGTLAASARQVRNSEIQLAELFGPVVDSKVRLARQTGVNHAIVAVSGALSQVPRDRYVE